MEDALALAACLHEHADRRRGAGRLRGRAPAGRRSPPSAPPRPAWSGSRTSATTCTRRPRSSPSTSSPAAAGSPTRTCGCATPSSSPARRVVRRPRPAPVELRPPMFHPFRLGGLELKNRVVVSAMDMYSAVDGLPTDFHLVHLGSKALGGAGLVMTEMVCISPRDGSRPAAPASTRASRRRPGPAHRRLRARAHRREDRRPARALRPQGLDQADVGGHRRAAARGQLGGGRPVALPYSPGQPDRRAS